MRAKLTRFIAILAFTLLLVASTTEVGLAGPPGSFPGQGTDNASNNSHCHVVSPATGNNQAGFTIVNPSEHAGGHAHGAPFTAIGC